MNVITIKEIKIKITKTTRKQTIIQRKHLGYMNNEDKDEICSVSSESVYFINNLNYTKDKNDKHTTWIYDTGTSETHHQQ